MESTTHHATPDQPPARYEIRVNGVLDSHWSAWFEGLAVTSDETGQTTITGVVADQAALHGLLAKVRDLGLPLLSVRHLGPEQQPTGGDDARTRRKA
jgi:hypothetical protein